MEKVIKIFGERNTGTNYLQRLLVTNFKEKCLSGSVPGIMNKFINNLFLRESIRDLFFVLSSADNLGWKHRELNLNIQKKMLKDNRDVKYIFLVKNPYSWILSLYKKPYHMSGFDKLTLDDLIVKPWKTVGRETNLQQYANAIDMWNKKVKSYYDFINKVDDAIILKYEDLLLNPIETLESIKENLELSPKLSDLVNITESTKDKGKNYDFYKKYYLEERWIKEFTDEQVRKINESLDVSLLRSLDYNMK